MSSSQGPTSSTTLKGTTKSRGALDEAGTHVGSGADAPAGPHVQHRPGSSGGPRGSDGRAASSGHHHKRPSVRMFAERPPAPLLSATSQRPARSRSSLVAADGSAAGGFSGGDVEVPRASVAGLGSGYYTLGAMFRSRAMNLDQASEAPTGGQDIEYRVQEITSYSSLRTALGLTASASFSGLFGSASAKAEYFSSVSVNRYSYFVIVSVHVTNSVQKLGDFTLRPEALDVLADGTPEDFAFKFGDEFVAGIVTGGDLYAVVEMQCETAEQYNAVKTQLSGKMGSWSASGSFESAMTSVNGFSQRHVTFLRRGTNDDVPQDADVISAARTFPTRIATAGNAVLLSGITMDYNASINFPLHVSPVSLLQARRRIEDLASIRDQLMLLGSDYSYVTDNPAEFKNPDITAISQSRSQVNDWVTAITRAAQDVVNNPFDLGNEINLDFAQCAPLPERADGTPPQQIPTPTPTPAPPPEDPPAPHDWHTHGGGGGMIPMGRPM